MLLFLEDLAKLWNQMEQEQLDQEDYLSLLEGQPAKNNKKKKKDYIKKFIKKKKLKSNLPNLHNKSYSKSPPGQHMRSLFQLILEICQAHRH